MKKKLFTLALAACALVTSLPAAAGPISDYLESAVLGHVFKGAAYTGPATTYVGLSTSACSDSSVGTEVTGGSYARVAVTSNGTNWTGPTSNNGTISNTNAVTFPAPTASWGSLTHWHVSDAPTAGNLLICAALTTPKTVNNGDAAPTFGAGALSIQIDN